MKRIFIASPYPPSEFVSSLARELETYATVVIPGLVGIGPDMASEVLSEIKRCHAFIACLDRFQPNTLFELGYALGCSRKVLLVREQGTEIPFDISSLPVVTVESFSISREVDSRGILGGGHHEQVYRIVDWVRKLVIPERTAEPIELSPREFLSRMVNDEDFHDSVQPQVFERQIFKYFIELGFDAEFEPVGRYSGVDILLKDFEWHRPAVVQVRKLNYNSRIAVSEVQRLVGAAVVAKAATAIYVTAGSFTSSARFLAVQSPLRTLLLTIQDLAELDRHRLTALQAEDLEHQ